MLTSMSYFPDGRLFAFGKEKDLARLLTVFGHIAPHLVQHGIEIFSALILRPQKLDRGQAHRVKLHHIPGRDRTCLFLYFDKMTSGRDFSTITISTRMKILYLLKTPLHDHDL